MNNTARQKPPKKKAGQGVGQRLLNGAVLDVRSGAAFIGGSEKYTRGLIARRLIPFRKIGGRITFLRSELDAWLVNLPGCTAAEAIANLEERRIR